MASVVVFDTTLRDGEQSPGASMTAAEKLRMAHQLDALGVDVLEAGFPISSPADFASVRAIARDVRRPIVAALARAEAVDVDRAAEAVEPAERGRIHVFLATSPIHLRRKLRISEEACIDRAAEAVRRARGHTGDVQFSAEDATRTDPGFLCRIVRVAIEAGATTINIPDTVGYTHPAEYRRLVQTLRANVPELKDVVLSVHCHDDLGLAVANSLAALEAGARQVECTINGIGERAGNAALEEVVMALRVRQDAFGLDTGVNTTELHRTSQLLSYLTGIQPQPNKAIVGRNAFAHEAGIHQDGVIKDPLTYEIMTPDMVGLVGNDLVLGKHSGRNGLARRYRELGYELSREEVDRTYKLFKLLADRKKVLYDEDLIAILHHGTMEDAPQVHRLRVLEVRCGKRQSEAYVGITVEGRERDAQGEGDGPLAAAFSAVESMVEFRTELEELEVHSATPGKEAVGEVTLRLRVDGKTFTGRGASTDIVDAAVRGYLGALDKAVQARELEAKHLEEVSYLWGV